MNSILDDATCDSPCASSNTGAAQLDHGREQKQQMQEETKQQHWLLFLRHCANCREDCCRYAQSCATGKDLWSHVLQCRDPTCTRTHCSKSRDLISHFSRCTTQCPICWPVREFITRTSVFPHAGPPDTHIAATAGAAAGPAAALFAAATAGSRAAAAAAAANAAAGAGTVHGDGDDDEQLLRLDSPTSSITSTGNWCPP